MISVAEMRIKVPFSGVSENLFAQRVKGRQSNTKLILLSLGNANVFVSLEIKLGTCNI